MLRVLLLVTLTAFAFPVAAAPAKLRIVVSFSILGDLVKNIAGDLADVAALVGPGGDAHSYQASVDDLKLVAQADLIFVNGMGFDPWMKNLANSSGYRGEIIVASRDIVPRIRQGSEHDEHDSIDPHLWQDPGKTVLYVENIAQALLEARPDRAEEIKTRKAAYQAAIKAVDESIRRDIATVPEEKRLIITSHDAFGYFGDAYGIRFLAPYGLSTESEPSASDIARLSNQIRKNGVHVIFLEAMINPRLVKQLAEDAGAVIGDVLYSDSLSAAGGPATDYLSMLKSNTLKFKAAMLRNGPV